MRVVAGRTVAGASVVAILCCAVGVSLFVSRASEAQRWRSHDMLGSRHYVSGYAYRSPNGGVAADADVAANLLYMIPFRVESTQLFSSIYVHQGNPATADVVLGIYRLLPNNYDAELLLAADPVAADAFIGSVVLSGAISQVLIEGWYYLAINTSANVPIAQQLTIISTGLVNFNAVPTGEHTHFSIAHTYDGTLPSTFSFASATALGSVSATGTMPLIELLAE